MESGPPVLATFSSANSPSGPRWSKSGSRTAWSEGQATAGGIGEPLGYPEGETPLDAALSASSVAVTFQISLNPPLARGEATPS